MYLIFTNFSLLSLNVHTKKLWVDWWYKHWHIRKKHFSYNQKQFKYTIVQRFFYSNMYAADYETVVSKFNEYFIPKKNIVYKQNMFFTRDQKTGESIDEYVKELRLLVSSCEFRKLVDTLIRGRLICWLIDNEIKERLLKEGTIGLEKVLDVSLRWNSKKTNVNNG